MIELKARLTKRTTLNGPSGSTSRRNHVVTGILGLKTHGKLTLVVA